MSCRMTKPDKSDPSLRCALKWVAKDPRFLHVDSEDSDQTGRMPRLIWVFAGRTGHFVGFVMRWLIWQSGQTFFATVLFLEVISWPREFWIVELNSNVHNIPLFSFSCMAVLVVLLLVPLMHVVVPFVSCYSLGNSCQHLGIFCCPLAISCPTFYFLFCPIFSSYLGQMFLILLPTEMSSVMKKAVFGALRAGKTQTGLLSDRG